MRFARLQATIVLEVCVVIFVRASSNNTTMLTGENFFLTRVYLESRSDEVGNKFVNKCGGTIISDTWILTAAHCIKGTSTGFVSYGSRDFEKMKTVPVYQYKVHEEFQQSSAGAYNNDIAVVQVEQPFNLDGVTATTAPMPDSDLYPFFTQGIIIGRTEFEPDAGYGHRKNHTVMKKINVKVVECIEHNFCSRSTEGELCMDDAGGPLFIRGMLYGVSSFLDNPFPQISRPPPCDDMYSIVLHASVPHYRKWIKKSTGL